MTCNVETGRALVEAGLHPATGGDGVAACSGDMLLEALVACAGVTLNAVATALAIELRGGTRHRGRRPRLPRHARRRADAPVGFRAIRLRFDLDTERQRGTARDSCSSSPSATASCYQTLKSSPPIDVSMNVK